MKTLSRITTTKAPALELQDYRGVLVYYPDSNLKHAALLHRATGSLVSFDGVAPYHPAGNMGACRAIIEGGGFVECSEMFLIPCRHVYDWTFMLNHITDTFEVAPC